MQSKNVLSDAAVAAFQPAEKIGLVASVNSEGLPHISLITSIRAISESKLTLGAFCEGRSKAHIQENPKIGFLVMTMDRKLFRGKAAWTHLSKEGPELSEYNDMPMFRYNAYFGIHTVHYLDLISTAGMERLPLIRILAAALLTRLAKKGASGNIASPVLKPFGQNLFNRLDALKFLAYINADGYPEIVPVIQCQAADSCRLAFCPSVYANELEHIPDSTTVAVHGLTMAMESVLIRGRLNAAERFRGIRLRTIDIEWVYNSMPPCHGQIYPPLSLTPVTEF